MLKDLGSTMQSRSWQSASSNAYTSINDNSALVKKMPNRVFVGGLPFDTTATELIEFFTNFGAVLDGKIIYDYENVSRGYGFITFYREEDVEKVLKLGVIFFKEKRLKIAEAFRRLKKRYPQRPAFPSPVQMTFPAKPQYLQSEQVTQTPIKCYTQPQVYHENRPTYGGLWRCAVVEQKLFQ
ncbi:deleted in azoospermia protein 4-like [Actinia tenebrosa]|uniref:Deleted in azoospermia protein 4-like n=1 Tax=Actinia tenebrosa TaxID=6105 RepID=A0A6P8HBA3_ACTTE|nr:deleted in azoospermia protein 4-like [Actinia tenebrosa]